MRNLYIVTGIVCLLLGGSAYLSSDSIWVGLITLVIAALGGFGFIAPSLKRFFLQNTKRHECYLFMHSFLITMSVTVSLDRSFEAATSSLGPMFHELDATLERMEGKEKIEYLIAYFQSDIYRMFLSILNLYMDRGGDVLRLSSELTAESARIEETEQQYERMAIRRAISFLALWLMALAIVTFVRFGLSTYFSSLRQSMTFLGAVLVFYGFMVLSFCVYCYFLTGVFPYRFMRKEAPDVPPDEEDAG